MVQDVGQVQMRLRNAALKGHAVDTLAACIDQWMVHFDVLFVRPRPAATMPVTKDAVGDVEYAQNHSSCCKSL
jgi:hypothetical protein